MSRLVRLARAYLGPLIVAIVFFLAGFVAHAQTTTSYREMWVPRLSYLSAIYDDGEPFPSCAALAERVQNQLHPSAGTENREEEIQAISGG